MLSRLQHRLLDLTNLQVAGKDLNIPSLKNKGCSGAGVRVLCLTGLQTKEDSLLLVLQMSQAGRDHAAAPEADGHQQSSRQLPLPAALQHTFPQAPGMQHSKAESVTEMPQPGVGSRPSSGIAGGRGQGDSIVNKKKPWGSSARFKSFGRTSGSSSGSGGGGGSGGRGKAAGTPRGELHMSGPQASLGGQRQHVEASDSSCTSSYLGSKGGISRSEGASPAHSPRRPAPRSPSFMDSTKSSQAHVHSPMLQGLTADAAQQDVHRPAFRPSGAHLVNVEAGGAEHASVEVSQHDDGVPSHGSEHAIGFMGSTESSRAHHEEEARSQHAQREHGRIPNAAASSMPALSQVTEGSQANAQEPSEVHATQTTNSDAHVRPDHAHVEYEPESGNAAEKHLLHQSADDEVPFRAPERRFDDSKRPSFMRPTASSIAHTGPVSPRGLNKSLSANVV